MGYSHGKKWWKLYDLETGNFFLSRDVKFYENEFSFLKVSAAKDSLDGAPIIEYNVMMMMYGWMKIYNIGPGY